jgi:hypothetical protein
MAAEPVDDDRRDRESGRTPAIDTLLIVASDPSGERPPADAVPNEPIDPAGGGIRPADPGPGRPEPRPQGMVPGRERRRTRIERASMRVVATGGIVGIATILGAALVSQDVAGWIVGLAVGVTSVALAALLWSSRQL